MAYCNEKSSKSVQDNHHHKYCCKALKIGPEISVLRQIHTKIEKNAKTNDRQNTGNYSDLVSINKRQKLLLHLLFTLPLESGFDECSKQRMRRKRSGEEFRMELRAEEEWMRGSWELCNLAELAIGRFTGKY